jgi:hypothetical protein
LLAKHSSQVTTPVVSLKSFSLQVTLLTISGRLIDLMIRIQNPIISLPRRRIKGYCSLILYVPFYCSIFSLFGWLVAGGWCWFVLREEYCWLVAGGWFDVREKYY